MANQSKISNETSSAHFCLGQSCFERVFIQRL